MRADDALMRGIAVGVEEADRDRLDSRTREQGRSDLRTLFRSSAVTMRPSRSMRSATSSRRSRGHERLRKFEEEIVDVVALLRAHFEDVAEALRGDEAELGALALDDGVGDQRRAMHDLADLGEPDAGHRDEFLEAEQRRLGRIVRRRQPLVQANGLPRCRRRG